MRGPSRGEGLGPESAMQSEALADRAAYGVVRVVVFELVDDEEGNKCKAVVDDDDGLGGLGLGKPGKPGKAGKSGKPGESGKPGKPGKSGKGSIVKGNINKGRGVGGERNSSSTVTGSIKGKLGGAGGSGEASAKSNAGKKRRRSLSDEGCQCPMKKAKVVGVENSSVSSSSEEEGGAGEKQAKNRESFGRWLNISKAYHSMDAAEAAYQHYLEAEKKSSSKPSSSSSSSSTITLKTSELLKHQNTITKKQLQSISYIIVTCVFFKIT